MSVTSGSAGSDVLVESTVVVEPADDGTKTLRSPVENFMGRAARAWPQIRSFVIAQPQWIVIGFLYFLVWYTPIPGNATMVGDGPLAWSWQFWASITFPLGFQLFVPAAVGLLIWSRRAALASQWKRIAANYPEHHPKREGNLLPLAAGVLILVFAHFVEVKGIGVIAAILIAAGVVYRLYGSVITRMLAMPFAVFLLMIPPPDTFIDEVCVGKTMNFELKAAAVLLNLMHIRTVDMIKFLQVNGIPVDFSTHVYSGFNVAVAAGFVVLVYCLYRKDFDSNCVWMVLLSAAAALFLHVFRVVAITATFGSQPELSHFLASSFVAWIEIGVTVGLALLLMRARFKVQINAPLSVHHAVRMAGTGIETMALPLIGVGKVARVLGIGWTWSERRVEQFLKAITPKRKRRRSSSRRHR